MDCFFDYPLLKTGSKSANIYLVENTGVSKSGFSRPSRCSINNSTSSALTDIPCLPWQYGSMDQKIVSEHWVVSNWTRRVSVDQDFGTDEGPIEVSHRARTVYYGSRKCRGLPVLRRHCRVNLKFGSSESWRDQVDSNVCLGAGSTTSSIPKSGDVIYDNLPSLTL